MKLYLVQHAEAMKEQEDPDRPLTEKGMADIEKTADFVAPRSCISVGEILHSGKTRARQTAEILGMKLEPLEGARQSKGLKPNDGVEPWAQKLSALQEDIMIVGHLPFLSRLASRLLCGDSENKLVNFQMGGIVCLQRDDGENWSVCWMVIPQML